MKHCLFDTDVCQATVAILIKEQGFNSQKIKNHYITPTGANPKGFIGFSLWYTGKTCPAVQAKEYLSELLAELDSLGITHILVADGPYFKFLTKTGKLDPHYGYVLDSKFEGYEDKFKVTLIPNYQTLSYNPKNQEKIDRGLAAMVDHLKGRYQDPGYDIIHNAEYPKSRDEVQLALGFLLVDGIEELTVDIEGLSLKFWECGIATISFAWDKHSGLAFPVDRGDCACDVKKLLKEFFELYAEQGGKLIPHNAGFDFKVLVYELWMDHLQDYEGMIQGIQVLTKCFDDTKLITYLATNNAIRNELGLKAITAEYTGDYAEDLKDTSKVPINDLLLYNLKDCLATWYAKEKYEPIMDSDDQRWIYENVFKPSVPTLLQTELCGMPIFPDKVQIAKKKLTGLVNGYNQVLKDSKTIQEFHLGQQEALMFKETANAKVKVFTMDDPKIQRFEFNPNSGTQLQKLIFDYMGYGVIDLTDKKQPATGGKTLKKLINHAKNDEDKAIFTALIGLAEAGKILSDFIPAFEQAVQMPDGSWRLFGNFNLGGTVSGRLSSSGPNLQNLPSHSAYAKLIKACFGCIPGWLFSGADFHSLEDMVSALTTRDKNKIKVYTDGYCGHCLRAYSYFGELMPDIINTVDSINSIKYKYPVYRQDSKPITFMKTYGGTYHGLMKNLGFSESKAMVIDANYHRLYSESDEWVAARIALACDDGYVTGCFGLRLRTPLLEKSGPRIGYKAAAEGRTAGNMLGQSYGMLNTRAANEFVQRVWKSPYRLLILPAAQIHDAGYCVHIDNIGCVKWMNDNMIECMQWCELEELKHPIVKLGAELDVFWPNWGNGITLPNHADKAQIKQICHKAKEKYAIKK